MHRDKHPAQIFCYRHRYGGDSLHLVLVKMLLLPKTYSTKKSILIRKYDLNKIALAKTAFTTKVTFKTNSTLTKKDAKRYTARAGQKHITRSVLKCHLHDINAFIELIEKAQSGNGLGN
ncbi:MAG: hypothetical protein ACSLEN_08885 [Candidatus Malihini olakiniferum]